MNVYEALFIIQLLVVVGIFLYKLYNIFNAGQIYPISISWLLFIGFFIAYFVGFVVTMTEPNILSGDTPTLVYSSVMNLETVLIVPNVIFLIIEYLFFLSVFGKRPVKAYKSKETNVFYAR